MSVPVDWKPERAVQEKIRGIQIYIFTVDWKPAGAILEKVRDFQKNKKQKTWLLKHVEGRTLCAGLKMATSSKLLINNGLSPQEASVATLCQVWHCNAHFGLFNYLIYLRNCYIFLYKLCDVKWRFKMFLCDVATYFIV